MSGHPAVQQALRNHYFDSLGLPASHQEDSRWSLEHSRLHRVPSGRRVKFGAIGTGLRASSALPETRTVEFVAANRLPAIYVWRWFVDSGVLMSYRPSSYELWRRAATVDKILRGAQSPPTFRSSSRPDRTGSQPQDGVSAVSSLIAALAGGAIFFANQLPAPVRVGVRLTRQIYAGDEVVDYAFMGSDPNSADNRWLRDAMQEQIPVIYFLGVSPGRYQPIVPTFVVGWQPERLRVQLAFGTLLGASAQATVPAAPERRYALREIKARLHQTSFRDAVLTAYSGRCAISHLPERRLLDAAHIVMDADEQLGQPVIPNGLLLTKIHHAAFDVHLIGIDPDFCIHVSDRLLEIHDGPFLELGLKRIAGQLIQLPRRSEDYPDRNRLALRFEQFKKAA